MRARRGDTGNDEQPIVEWRLGCLRAAGFGRDLARALAADSAYDLHALLELFDAGCPHALAVRIVAPLDERGGAC